MVINARPDLDAVLDSKHPEDQRQLYDWHYEKHRTVCSLTLSPKLKIIISEKCQLTIGKRNN